MLVLLTFVVVVDGGGVGGCRGVVDVVVVDATAVDVVVGDVMLVPLPLEQKEATQTSCFDGNRSFIALYSKGAPWVFYTPYCLGP